MSLYKKSKLQKIIFMTVCLDMMDINKHFW